MCAHYTLFTDDQIEEIREIVRIVEKKTGKPQANDIWPGYTAPVLVPAAGRKLTVEPMTWGYPVPYKKKDGTYGATQYRQNTRMDTAHNLPLWQDSYENRRCLIPAAAFYENHHRADKTVIPTLFFSPGAMLYIAAIWKQEKDGGLYCSMLTTDPNADTQPIHDRMPLVLAKNELGQWLYGDYDELACREHIRLASMPAPQEK